MTSKFLKTNEAAKFLGVSRSSLTNWVKQGLLDGGVTPGGHYRFTTDELIYFADRRGLSLPDSVDEHKAVRILVIEDDESFREFLKDALEEFSGYELKETVDGMKGALLVGTWMPDLIILDIRMPNMNGIEFLRMLRENPNTSEVKVIVASAHLSPETRRDVENLDADIILEKPVRLARLVAAIQQLIKLKLS
jgi:excisionase family DNA binding protein